ncbi:flagellar basal body-associated FliL family protein [Salibaculum sp.]|uniref:flagellar basal body-associated FliL family protein n=1 Tax=Salibaculum sp. TaxID=2855480 RepID=UPI002B4A3C3C|nr:flagellar basal body-associated FliL family protein [Salibaculum sp.]HKL68116.1 flagellar basal body-associated FliL family protein [Salibaculum sp.]
MARILLPLLLLVMGLGGGVGAGLFLAPPPAKEEVVAEDPCGVTRSANKRDAAQAPDEDGAPITDGREYARLNNQFVVPVVQEGKVSSLVVLSLSVEVETGAKENVFAHEPRLRDLFLQVLFDHANMGGFNGAFTASSNMKLLRDALRQTAIRHVGGGITDVLIIDIVRQDVAG